MSKEMAGMSEKPNRRRRRQTLEFKQAAVRMVTEEGLSQAEVSRRLGIPQNSLQNWKRSLKGGTAPAGPGQPSALEAELLRLRAENERLRMEREILKKATAFFAKELR
jgi:transposase